MRYKRLKLVIGALFLLMIISVQPVAAATVTWHSSIKEGGSWKWKVTKKSGDIGNYLDVLGELDKGITIEVKAVGNPPTVGTWIDLVSHSSIAWVDYYINGTKQENLSESAVYFFVTPLDIGNATTGWTYAANTVYTSVAIICAFVVIFGGTVEYLQHKTNGTDTSTVNHEIKAAGTILGGAAWSLRHDMYYNNETGLLKEYTFDYSNSTLSSSITIARDQGGLLGDIPGFEVYGALLGLGFIAIITILRRKK